ncbi:MAG TPA: DUF4340 domain-containing protein [Polyangiaceae bacterium]
MNLSARATVTPIVLVVLATGAVAYAWFIDRGSVSDAERASRRSDVFPSFHVEDVTHVELVHGDEKLVLDRDRDAGGGSSWSMTSPRQEHADAGAVDALLRELTNATRLRDVSDRDAVGLDEPRVHGVVRVGALEWRFVLGADAPRPEGAAYMRLEGEGTFVVQRSVKVQLLRGADAYRSRALFPFGANDIRRVHVATAPDGAFTLERQHPGAPSFRVVEDGVRASRETTDRVLTALDEARAESFVDDATADRELARTVFAVTVEPFDEARPRVELKIAGSCPGQPADDLLVETAPVRISACVARTLADALRNGKTALDDASPFFARADEMEELRLEAVGPPGPRVDIARKGAGWHERAPEDRELSSDEVDAANAIALALASARGSQVRRATEADRFAPRARATIVRTGGASTEVVELGPADADGSAWVRRADDGALVRLPASQARRFEPHPIALRARALWHAPFDPAAVVGIDDTCGPVPEKLALRDGSWTMLAPAGFAVDPVAVSDLAGAFAHAKADAWISESDDGSFGLGRPRDGGCAVTLALAATDGGPSRSVTLSFGGDAGGGSFYARVSDDPGVFAAAGVLHALASHPAIDRKRLRIDPHALSSVTLVHGDTRRAVTLDADAPDALAKAVEGLYAEAALHTGAPTKSEGMDHPALEVLGTGVHVSIGAPATVDGIDGYYARAAGVDATFIVPKHAVDAITSAMGD